MNISELILNLKELQSQFGDVKVIIMNTPFDEKYFPVEGMYFKDFRNMVIDGIVDHTQLPMCLKNKAEPVVLLHG